MAKQKTDHGRTYSPAADHIPAPVSAPDSMPGSDGRSSPHVAGGPILFARGCHGGQSMMAALVILPAGVPPAQFVTCRGDGITPVRLTEQFGRVYWRFDFSLPADAGYGEKVFYNYDNVTYPVETRMQDGLNIAFVSCNGQEQGDLDRPVAERNALWADLARQHEYRPFCLLLHGGDQIYADGVWQCHPAIAAWRKAGRDEKQAAIFDDGMRDAVLRFYLELYLDIYSQPPIAGLLARIPSLMMWDDHDIFDGWGSHPEPFQEYAVAQGIFACARMAFCLMQLGALPGSLPAIVGDGGGASLGWRVDYPGFSVVAPDLRSERKPDAVMGHNGWQKFLADLDAVPKQNRILLMSSVPVIGPRLSLVEAALHLLPHAQKYEDDLRDQWQSRAHRQEWCRFLEKLEDLACRQDHDITLLSGEIHLATRGEFVTGVKTVHQLVASGISHTAPPVIFARILGILARIGENPLPGRPTRLKPLPGRRGIYCATRNYLTLHRTGKIWQANWHLEDFGRTDDFII